MTMVNSVNQSHGEQKRERWFRPDEQTRVESRLTASGYPQCDGVRLCTQRPTQQSRDIDPVLVQCKRWPNIKATLGQYLVFAESYGD